LLNNTGEILLISGLVLVYVFIFVFWLVMLIDAVRNRGTQGTVWIIVIALVGFIGSIIYYFAMMRKRKKRLREAGSTEPVVSDASAYYLGGTQKEDVISE
jgi:hypothetical protein